MTEAYQMKPKTNKVMRLNRRKPKKKLNYFESERERNEAMIRVLMNEDVEGMPFKVKQIEGEMLLQQMANSREGLGRSLPNNKLKEKPTHEKPTVMVKRNS